LVKKVLSSALLLVVCCTPLIATVQQDNHDNQHYVHHTEWKHGYPHRSASSPQDKPGISFRGALSIRH
jgi:hypothetical protein